MRSRVGSSLYFKSCGASPMTQPRGNRLPAPIAVVAGEINVRPDDAIRAQLDASVNHGIRPDLNGRVQFRLRDE
jgi:hypothetical protein